MIDRIRLSFIPIKTVFFNLMVRMLIIILALTSKNKIFVINNIIIFFRPKVVATKRKNLNIYIIL